MKLSCVIENNIWPYTCLGLGKAAENIDWPIHCVHRCSKMSFVLQRVPLYTSNNTYRMNNTVHHIPSNVYNI